MTAVGELVLVLGLLVSAHCEVRARDPEVEEEEEEWGRRAAARGGGGGGELGAAFPPHLDGLHPGLTEPPPQGENQPARTGNWCAFVQERVVTVAVVCGTEKYTIKSQSPCPSGIPDCQLVLYKLSTRPVYTQKQKMITALQWRCCPGHGGQNCEDTVPDPQAHSGTSALIGRSEPEGAELHAPAVQARLQQWDDPNREQNDSQGSVSDTHATPHTGHAHHETPRPTPHPGHAHHETPRPRPRTGPAHHEMPRTTPHPAPAHHETPRPTSHPGHTHHETPRPRPRTGPAHHRTHSTALHVGHAHEETPRLILDHAHRGTPRHAHDQDHAHQQTRHAQDPGHAHNHHDASHHPHHRLPEATIDLLVPTVMAQLQSVLEGFNRSLDHLSRQVGDLAQDVAQLKSERRPGGAEALTLAPEEPELSETAEERLEAKLDEVFLDIASVRRQMASQRAELENRLHSQHAMLHYNLTGFKTEIDMRLKRHHKMLQVSLQAMNATLSELKLDQDQMSESDDRPAPPPQLPQPSDSSVLWEAIERLDNVVVNNTVKVNGLMEDMEVTSGNVQQLRWDIKELEKYINQTARKSQILFMETGLEVEDAKVAVLRRVEELARNLTQHDQQLQEVDVDMDYLYTILYQNHSGTECDCKGLRAAVVQLERGVANVSALANENRLTLEEDSEGALETWGGASDWEPAVEVLQHDVQKVKQSLASEQNRTRTLDHSLSKLSSLVTVSLAEVSGLKDRDKKLKEDMQYLSSAFNSLLKDAIRHNDLLELLLGEEVLEFLEWPPQDQEANSIPALREQLRHLQEQLRRQELSITSLLGSKPGSREEVPSADQPSSASDLLLDDWLPGSMSRSKGGVAARERQLLLHPEGRLPEHGGDGGDLWNLEKTVEELELKVLRMEEKPCTCPNTSADGEVPSGGEDAKLQAELMWLKRGLEEHLRVFKNVFSNADVLVESSATLELDKLWQLVKNKDGKKEKKRGGGREGSGRGNHRSRRESSGVAPIPLGQSEDSLLFVAGSPLKVSNGIVAFQPSLNRGQFYSDTGTFAAPVDGVYLFILTLDLRPGSAHSVLRRGSGGAPVSLHRGEVTAAGPATGVGLLRLRAGEEVRLELRGGAWRESEDNVFAGLLLHRTT